jgi:hypothetical protein
MPITVEQSDISNVAPELASQTQERVDLFIEYARLFVNEEKWGSKAKFGIVLYACHLLTLSSSDGRSGITSEKVGELQVNYAAPQGDDELNQTPYGMMYRNLRKTLPFTPLVV